MKLDEIQNLWEQDCKIDKSILDVESLGAYRLHNKFYKIYIPEKMLLSKLRKEFNAFKKLKWEYYSGKLDGATCKSYGWDQFQYNLMKSELDIYIDGDKQIIEKELELEYQKEKVTYLEKIIDSINNRQFAISNAIKFLKFTNGEV